MYGWAMIIGALCICSAAVCIACAEVSKRQRKIASNGYVVAPSPPGRAAHGTSPSSARADPGHASGTPQSRQDSPSREDSRIGNEFMYREFLATAGDMGFEREQALAALVRANEDTDVALDLLLA